MSEETVDKFLYGTYGEWSSASSSTVWTRASATAVATLSFARVQFEVDPGTVTLGALAISMPVAVTTS